MKKNNLILELLKMFGACICGWLLWLIIFSITLPPDETGATSEPFPGAICVLGIVTAVVILLIIRYNKLQKAYQRTKASYSNIKVFKERTDRLLEKANRVADKYMIHEENIQVQVSRNRSRKPKAIRNSKEFQIALENYPNLKANESIMELLTQIKDTENGYAQSKLNYNADVEKYNTSIHSFPDVILKKLFGFQDAEFYNDESEHEVTDAELGI